MDVTPSEAALLDQITAAKERCDVESLCAVLAAHPASPLLVGSCCDALVRVVSGDAPACAAAVACGALDSVVRAVREHHAAPFALAASWALMDDLMRQETARASVAVDGGALECAVASLGDMSENVVFSVLSALPFLTARADHASRAVQLGMFKVRYLETYSRASHLHVYV